MMTQSFLCPGEGAARSAYTTPRPRLYVREAAIKADCTTARFYEINCDVCVNKIYCSENKNAWETVESIVNIWFIVVTVQVLNQYVNCRQVVWSGNEYVFINFLLQNLIMEKVFTSHTSTPDAVHLFIYANRHF